VGNGAGGLLGRRDVLGLPAARPRAEPRVSLGRGRAPRDHRPRMPALLRGRALERSRPDPQGAALRPHRSRGQSRRGREGVLLLPRRDAHRLLSEGTLQVSATRVPVCAAGRGGPAPREARRGARAGRHGHLRRRSLFRRHRRVREGLARRHFDPRDGRQPRSGRGAAPRSAVALVPQHLVVGAHRRGLLAEASPGTRRRGGNRGRARIPRPLPARGRGRPRPSLHRERDQRRPALRRAERLAVREGRLPRVRRPRPDRRGERRRTGHQGRHALHSHPTGRRRSDAPPAPHGGDGSRRAARGPGGGPCVRRTPRRT